MKIYDLVHWQDRKMSSYKGNEGRKGDIKLRIQNLDLYAVFLAGLNRLYGINHLSDILAPFADSNIYPDFLLTAPNGNNVGRKDIESIIAKNASLPPEKKLMLYVERLWIYWDMLKPSDARAERAMGVDMRTKERFGEGTVNGYRNFLGHIVRLYERLIGGLEKGTIEYRVQQIVEKSTK